MNKWSKRWMNDFKIYKNNHVEEIYSNILFGILVCQLLIKYKKDISTSSYGISWELINTLPAGIFFIYWQSANDKKTKHMEVKQHATK